MNNTELGSVIVIGDEATVMMYRSIGCQGIIVSNPFDLLKKVELYARRSDVTVILVIQDLSEPVRTEIERIMEKTGKIISYIPTPRSAGQPVNMRKILMKALGFG